MRAYCCKIALISTALIWWSATAPAEVVLRDDFDDAAMDTSLWTPSEPVAMEMNEEYGVLRMVASGGKPAKGNVALNAGLVGDFDIRVSYELLAYSGGGNARAQLYVRGPSSYVCLYYHRYEASANEIIFAGTLGGEAQVYAYEQNVPDAGKLCVTRKGTKLTAYYWSGVRWRVLVSRDGFAGEATVKIAASSSSNSPGFVLHFDDVWIKAEAASSPLAFTVQPSGAKRYTTGGGYTMRVATEGGVGDVRYRWMFAGEGDAAIVGEGNTYTIEAPTVERSGEYWCEASDRIGTAVSEKATVRFAAPLQFTNQPEGGLRYADDGPVRMTVAVSGGMDAPAFRWMFDDGSGPKTVGEGPSFVVEAPAPSHSGTYWCEAADAVERIRSNTAGLLVAEHLSLTAHPQSAERKAADGPHELTAAASGGLPPLIYRWMFDNGSEPACVGTGTTLKIAEPVPAHSGIYWCEVSDANETVRSNTASLLVAP